MRVIIAGSRLITYMQPVEELIEESGYDITEVVCGMARGVDESGCRWATLHNIPIKEFPALWDKHGKRAGYLRNKEMGEYADALILLRYEDSKGSIHMQNIMEELGKPYALKILPKWGEIEI